MLAPNTYLSSTVKYLAMRSVRDATEAILHGHIKQMTYDTLGSDSPMANLNATVVRMTVSVMLMRSPNDE